MRPFLSMARLSWPVQASLVCLAFLLVGVVVVDDYGAGHDTPIQRHIAARNLAFITGAADRLDGFAGESDRYYGVAFELPLLLLERGLGLEDSRRIYLMRHLVTHAFFLVGGLCCSLLVYRLTRSRGVALFALLLFVVQPRLYAHSFFNSKNLPFLSMFMVTLYVTHRAFREETVGAFVLCGVCVGVLLIGVEMIQIHPHQHMYFNRLVDRTTPEYLRVHYTLDPWTVSCREGLEFLLERYPATMVHMRIRRDRRIQKRSLNLPREDRARLMLVRSNEAEFEILCRIMLQRARRILIFENIVYNGQGVQ